MVASVRTKRRCGSTSFLGTQYRIDENFSEAVKWFRRAASAGNSSAQYDLGMAHFMGEGAIQDKVSAHMWFNVAASNGHKLAKTMREYLFSQMTPADISKAQELARECVRKNYKRC